MKVQKHDNPTALGGGDSRPRTRAVLMGGGSAAVLRVLRALIERQRGRRSRHGRPKCGEARAVLPCTAVNKAVDAGEGLRGRGQGARASSVLLDASFFHSLALHFQTQPSHSPHTAPWPSGLLRTRSRLRRRPPLLQLRPPLPWRRQQLPAGRCLHVSSSSCRGQKTAGRPRPRWPSSRACSSS